MMKDFLIAVGCVLLFVVILVSITITAMVGIDKQICIETGQATSAVTDISYSLFTGCMWEVRGEWIPASSFREVM